MTEWTSDELTQIEAADELRIVSLRPDGMLSRPRSNWVVRHGDDVFVRSVNGPTGAWYRGTQLRHVGHIQVGGVVDDDLDAAYRAKYRRYAASIIAAINSPEARSATLRLVPR